MAEETHDHTEEPIGKVSHYYDKIGVAIVELTKPLKVGDSVHFKGNKTDFIQTASSMQIEHKDVQEAKTGDVIGVKVDQETRQGDKIYIHQ